MTFTEIKQAVKDYCLLSSAEADTRVSTAINRHYRRITSQLGLDATRFVTRPQATTPSGQTVTFTAIEKLDRVLDVTDLTARRLLMQVSLHELRAQQPGAGPPTQWALQNTDAAAATILLDTQPPDVRSLQADGWTTLADLAGSDEPVFPESFHDVLVWFVISEELLKKEKLQLAGTYDAKAEKLLADLRFHLADSPTRLTQQADGRISLLGAGGAGGGGGLTGHAPTHEAGGSDPIDLGALAGVITLAQLVPHAATHDASGSDAVAVTALGGFPGGTATYLRADATFATPPDVVGVGDVVGPASSVDDRIATFDGATGKLIQDGGQTIAEVMAAALSAAVPRGFCEGRLSLTSGTAVTTADVTAATTLYWVPVNGGQVALYTGSAWVLVSLAQLSIAVPATASTLYDVFIDYNGGTPVLALTAWTNDTTRATALTTQDSVLVQTGNPDWRYVGSFRTTTVSGQTEDSAAKRYVWNSYHQKRRPVRIKESTNQWAYTLLTWRQANDNTANQVDVVVGVAGESTLTLRLLGLSSPNTANVSTHVAIGEDSTTTPHADCLLPQIFTVDLGGIRLLTAWLETVPAIGRHVYTWLERSVASGNTVWYGDNGGVAGGGGQTGLSGTCDA